MVIVDSFTFSLISLPAKIARIIANMCPRIPPIITSPTG